MAESITRVANPGQEYPDEDEFIDFYDFLTISSGADEDGTARSAIAMILFTDSGNGEIYAERSVEFGNAIPYFCANGNALVLECVFSGESVVYAQSASNVLKEWLSHMRDASYLQKHALHLIVTPLLLGGGIFMDLSLLAYSCMYFDGEKHEWHLIMAFSVSPDDGSVEFHQTEGISMSDIEREVNAELTKDREDAQREYEKAMAEAEEEERRQQEEEMSQYGGAFRYSDSDYQNMGMDSQSETKSSENSSKKEKKEEDDSWMRISHDH